MNILQLQNIQVKFPNTNKCSLQKINFTVEKNDFVIVLGSNGSGKSTLLKLLYKQYRANIGDIHFLNQPISSYSEKKFNQQIAILTQDCNESLFASLSVYENFLLVKKFKAINTNHLSDREFLKDYLYEFNCNLSNKLDMTINVLSGGEKQALALAFCLLRPPTLLLLDEHTSALDPKTSDQIMELTQQKVIEHQITCLLTTHNLNIAMQYGNRILALRDGQIYKDIFPQQKALITKDMLMNMYY